MWYIPRFPRNRACNTHIDHICEQLAMTTNESDDERLRRIHILESVPTTKLSDIARRCRWMRYPANKTIIYQDSGDNDVHMLCEGTARATVLTPSGDKMVNFDFLSAGTIFGEMSAIDRTPRSTDVLAMTDCVVASLTSTAFIQLLSAYPQVSQAVMCKIIGHVRTLCSRVYEYRALPVSARIDLALIRMAEGEPTTEEPIPISRPITQELLAEHIDTERISVTKHYTLLHNEGLIHRNRRQLIVLSLEGLRRRVDAALNSDE